MTPPRPRMHEGARGADKGYTGATGTKRGTIWELLTGSTKW